MTTRLCKNVDKYFHKYEEIQFGHMMGQRQGVQSTKKVFNKEQQQEEEKDSKLLEEKLDILIKINNVQGSFDKEQAKWHKNAIHTDQTEKLSCVSSWGQKYQMVLYHIDSNTIWVKPYK